MIALTQKNGQKFTLNDSKVWYVQQLHIGNDSSAALDGCKIVYKNNRQFSVVENLSVIESKTWTTRWIKVTRLDNNFQYLCFRDLIAQATPISGVANNSEIEWDLSTASKWSVVETLDVISAAPSSSSSSNALIANELIVAKNGNDANALATAVVVNGITVYDQNVPFANPTVAMNAAVAPAKVSVKPGLYTIGVGGNVIDDGLQYMVKDGVVLDSDYGATIHYTNVTGTVSLPFSDSGSAGGSFVITGKGKFIFDRDISGGDSFIVTTNENSIVDWEFDEIISKRRFGGNGHNSKSWRMNGRRWYNSQSMLFALRYTGNTAERFIDINVEDVECASQFSFNSQWVRSEIRNFGNGSIANIEFKKIKYNQSFPNGGFHQNTNCSSTSIINITFPNFLKTADTFIDEYMISHVFDLSGGDIVIKNFDTSGGTIKQQDSFGAGILGLSSTSRRYVLHGKVRNGSGAFASYWLRYVRLAIRTSFDLKIDHEGTAAGNQSTRIMDTIDTTYSGEIRWVNSNQGPFSFNSVTGNIGKFYNMAISISGGAPCMTNLNAVAANVRIISVDATTVESPLNGGIVPLIEPINQNNNV